MSEVRHVDLVRNDPSTGSQRRLATLEITSDNTLKVTGHDGEDWVTRVEQLGGPIDHQSPIEYVDALARRLANSTYIALSDAHTEQECPFLDGNQIQLDPRAGHLASAR